VGKSLKSLISDLFRKRSVGPSPVFEPHHIIMTIFILKREGGLVGRYRLVKELGLGEAAVKTLLKHLRRLGLVGVRPRRGHFLTELGNKVADEIMSRIKAIKEVKGFEEIAVGPVNVVCHLRGLADIVKSGVEQRDAAIMAGAMGATTIISKGGKLFLAPGDYEVPEKVSRILRKEFDIMEGDVLIVGSADNLINAQNGAIAAALTLLLSDSSPCSR